MLSLLPWVYPLSTVLWRTLALSLLTSLSSLIIAFLLETASWLITSSFLPFLLAFLTSFSLSLGLLLFRVLFTLEVWILHVLSLLLLFVGLKLALSLLLFKLCQAVLASQLMLCLSGFDLAFPSVVGV
jgi:hypothetical protein